MIQIYLRQSQIKIEHNNIDCMFYVICLTVECFSFIVICRFFNSLQIVSSCELINF